MVGIVVGNKEYNPRYVFYAAAHGKDPEDMLKYDWENHRYMHEFVVWNRKKLDEFIATHPDIYNWKATGFSADEKRYIAAVMFAHDYDTWLAAQVGVEYNPDKKEV